VIVEYNFFSFLLNLTQLWALTIVAAICITCFDNSRTKLYSPQKSFLVFQQRKGDC
jgi:hypothetical protein